jgi:hypothetical protein
VTVTIENYKEYLETLFPSWRGFYYIDSKCKSIIMEHIRGFSGSPYIPFGLDCLYPIKSDKFPGKLSIYRNQDSRLRETADGMGIRTAMKPGRAIAYMLPFLSQEEVQKIALALREYLEIEETPPEIYFGTDREDFKRMYTGGPISARNRRSDCNGFEVKQLDSSCMRHDFSNLPCHPAETYASGDFLAAWVEESGCISARCVVGVKDGLHVPGPIYSQCGIAAETLAQAIRDRADSEGCSVSFSGWQGLSMLKILHNGNPVGPYIDDPDSSLLMDNGDNLEICDEESADYESRNTGGLMSEVENCRCADCEERMSEPHSCNDSGDTICECCAENYAYCDGCSSTVANDDIVIVNIRLSRYWSQECRCNSCVERGYIETDSGEYWPDYAVITTADGSIISPDEFEQDYFTCEGNDKIYHNSDMADCIDTEFAETTVSVEYMRNLPLIYTETSPGSFRHREAS